MHLPIDLVRAVLDGHEHWFVAHLVAARGAWFRRRTVIVMNAAFVGDANLGPRAHPGDGLIDVTDGRLGLSDRRSARSRFGSGTHLPHPDLATRRATTFEVELADPTPVHLDGEPVGTFRSISVEVVPDALVVVA
jgi:diacylglycerol kinase family enzyme